MSDEASRKLVYCTCRCDALLTCCSVLSLAVTIPSAAFTPAVRQSPSDGARTSIDITSTVTPQNRRRSPSTATILGVRAARTHSTGWITSAITYGSFTKRTLRSEAAPSTRNG